MFRKKGVLRNFAKFTGKHLCLRPASLLKKRLWHRCFLLNFVKFLRTLFFIEHLWWLLLIFLEKSNFKSLKNKKIIKEQRLSTVTETFLLNSGSLILQKYYVEIILRIKKGHLNPENLSKSIYWSKYNAFSFEKYYFLDAKHRTNIWFCYLKTH